MDRDLLERWRGVYSAAVIGFDLAELDGPMVVDEAPWSYEATARVLLAGAGSALDLGTGGGEVLSGLADALPIDTVATEGWKPNVPVATVALAPLGIEVVHYDAEIDPELPFPAGRFDVVLARHEAYDAAEVRRVLRGGGRFLTQQIDGRSFEEAHRMFGGATPHGHITLADLRAEAERAGFVIELAEEWQGTRRFADVDALLRYVAIVPWEVPADFSVDTRAATLLELHDSEDDITFPYHPFILQARR